MSDPQSIFYKVGQATKSKISTDLTQAIADLKAANNVFTGTNEFQNTVTVGQASNQKNLTVNGNTTISGDLTVNGNTSTISTTNLDVKDNIITLNDGASGTSAEASDSGILFERASGTQNAAILFEETGDRFELGVTSGTGAAVSLGAVSLGTIAINKVLIGTRAQTASLGDLADFQAGLTT
jgi:hypothetical protein